MNAQSGLLVCGGRGASALGDEREARGERWAERGDTRTGDSRHSVDDDGELRTRDEEVGAPFEESSSSH
jgi:hypothetical protein